jgi:type IV secretory pathway TrbD component
MWLFFWMNAAFTVGMFIKYLQLNVGKSNQDPLICKVNICEM